MLAGESPPAWSPETRGVRFLAAPALSTVQFLDPTTGWLREREVFRPTETRRPAAGQPNESAIAACLVDFAMSD